MAHMLYSISAVMIPVPRSWLASKLCDCRLTCMLSHPKGKAVDLPNDDANSDEP